MWRQHGNALDTGHHQQARPASEPPPHAHTAPYCSDPGHGGAWATAASWHVQPNAFQAPPPADSRASSSSSWLSGAARVGAPPHRASPFDSLTSLYPPSSPWKTYHVGGGPSAVPSANTSAISIGGGGHPSRSVPDGHHPASATVSLSDGRPNPVGPLERRQSADAAHAQGIAARSAGYGRGATDDLVHSRSFADVRDPTPTASDKGTRGGSSSNEPSIAADIASLQGRIISLSSVNLQLQQEVDALRHEVQRHRVDSSRMKDQLKISSAQETFLKGQLELVMTRQQQLLAFERTPEGQGQQELLLQQNGELKRHIEAKEHELRTMQQRLQASMERTRALEDALVNQQLQQPSAATTKTQGPTTKPSGPSDDADAAAATERRLKPVVASSLGHARFAHSTLLALRHIMLTPHDGSGHGSAHGDTSIGGGPPTCALTQRHCAMRCVSLAAQGSQDNDGLAALHGPGVPLETLVRELCEYASQQHTLIVTTATRFLGAVTEAEAEAMGAMVEDEDALRRSCGDDAALTAHDPDQQTQQWSSNGMGAGGDEATGGVTYRPPPPLHMKSVPPPPAAVSRGAGVVVHRTIPPRQRSASPPSDGGGTTSILQSGHSSLRTSREPSPSQPDQETKTYTLPSTAQGSADGRARNVVRVERQGQRSPTTSQPPQSPTPQVPTTDDRLGPRTGRHMPTIQPPRRSSVRQQASTDHYGGCEQQ